jgi:trans-2,3-dihydro-3-hydroxyanthranilate isomerase
MRLPFFTVDVFTTRRFAGNPLAIVEQADALTTAQMQTIAREFNLSETIFVRRPADPAHTASVRIFFPTAEIPFAGHPTIGCAIHLARKQQGPGDFEAVITLEEVAGLVPVRVTAKGGAIEAQLTAPVVPFAGAGSAPDAAMAAAALGLSTSEVGLSGHAIAQWQGGPTFLFVPVANVASLSAARPCEPAWSAMMNFAGVDNAYVYTRHPADPHVRAHCRHARRSGNRFRLRAVGGAASGKRRTCRRNQCLCPQAGLRHGPAVRHRHGSRCFGRQARRRAHFRQLGAG